MACLAGCVLHICTAAVIFVTLFDFFIAAAFPTVAVMSFLPQGPPSRRLLRPIRLKHLLRPVSKHNVDLPSQTRLSAWSLSAGEAGLALSLSQALQPCTGANHPADADFALAAPAANMPSKRGVLFGSVNAMFASSCTILCTPAYSRPCMA